MSSLHHSADIREDEAKKPEIIHHYNSTKAGVDALDQLVANYTCKRLTRRWPVALFSNMIDVSAYNSYVIWTEINPAWNCKKNFKRRLYLVELAEQMIDAHILRRTKKPRGQLARDLVQNMQEAQCSSSVVRPLVTKNDTPYKRQRCFFCPHHKNSSKHSNTCDVCKKFICQVHKTTICVDCFAAYKKK